MTKEQARKALIIYKRWLRAEDEYEAPGTPPPISRRNVAEALETILQIVDKSLQTS